MASTEDTVTKNNEDEQCSNAITSHVTTIAIYMLGFLIIVFCCKGMHWILRSFFSQPRIISEFIVGLIFANLPFVRDTISSTGVSKTLNYLADFGMVVHTFVLGLEIDYKAYVKKPFREVRVAFAGLISTFVLAFLVNPFLNLHLGGFTRYGVCLALVLSSTASPLLTRLITDLKIGKSDIGRFVVSTGVLSDLVILVNLSIGFVVFDPMKNYQVRKLTKIGMMSLMLLIEILIAARLTPLIFRWVNSENPEGKQMKGSHLILSVAYIVAVIACSPTLSGFNSMLSAFLAGMFMPREGRISKTLVAKTNFFLSVIFYPLLLLWVGVEADFAMFGANTLWPWLRFFIFFVTTTVGKVLGSVISGVLLGFHWQESVAIGLLLNIKGHLHVYLATVAAKNQITSVSTSLAMLFASVCTIVYTPLVVKNIIKRARRRSPTQLMALQWLDPSTQLKILVCLHGPNNVPSAINVAEVSRGEPVPGIMAYMADMVELTDRVAATLIHGDGNVAMTVTDETVVDMREEIGRLVNAYIAEDREGVTITRKLALATINSLHQDICIMAEELGISMIVLPFHKEQKQDGRLGLGHSGFRHVNRKVLRHAPCSVGILVDRGLGSANKLSRTSGTLNCAVIFIGGKDDREALAFSGRLALHSGVKLTVIRFLVESNTEEGSEKPGRPRVKTHEYEEEMKLDDEAFAGFYDKHVARGRVAYMEKHLVNSGQTFATLRSIEGQYGLFIVGRGGRVNSVLTVGMNDWEECPELGPIGDILSASDFSVTTSVLIIQQHSLRGELAGLDDEFSIM